MYCSPTKSSVIFFLMSLTLVLTSQSSWALPTRDLWIPQTRTLAFDQKAFAVEQTFNTDKRSSDSFRSEHTSSFGLNYGAFQRGDVGMELGVDWREPAREEASEALYGNIRIRARDVDRDGWAVALGAQSLGFKAGVNDVNIIYLLIQNDIDGILTTEMGGYSGNAKLLVDENGKQDNQGALVGIWRQLDSEKHFKVGLEWMTGHNAYGFIFGGVSFRFRDFISGAVGYGFANNRVTMRDSGLVRLNMEF